MCASVHAEANAIISASRRDMIGATLYLVGHEANGTPVADTKPCMMCHRLILNAGLSTIITRDADGAIKVRKVEPTERYDQTYKEDTGDEE